MNYIGPSGYHFIKWVHQVTNEKKKKNVITDAIYEQNGTDKIHNLYSKLWIFIGPKKLCNIQLIIVYDHNDAHKLNYLLSRKDYTKKYYDQNQTVDEVFKQQ